MNKYHVLISYMKWPAFRTVLQADNEQEAFAAADRESPYPSGSVYLSKFSKAELINSRG